MNEEDYRSISSKKWFIQGFNSCLNYIMHGPISSLVYCHEMLGYGYTEQLFIFEGDYLEYHYLEKDLIEIGNKFLQKCEEDSSYWDNMFRKNQELNDIAFSVVEKVKSKNLPDVPNDEIFSLFHEIADSYTAPTGISHSLEGISYVAESKLKELISKHLGISHRDKRFIDIFSSLLQPMKRSFIGEESLELYSIAKEILKDKNLADDFRNLLPEEILEKLPDNMKKRISKHKDKFFFNRLNYIHADGLSELDYIIDLKELIIGNIFIDKRIEEENERYRKNNERRDELINKHGFSDEIVGLINLCVKCLHWQDDRKKYMLGSIFWLDKVLKEIGKRYDIPIESLKLYSWKDINPDFLKNFDFEDAKERKKHYGVYFSRDSGALKEEYLMKDEYKKFIEIYKKEDPKQNDMHGMCASSGKAIGKARICRTVEDIKMFGEGEVLVTMMTRPEFIPAMKKASAIVTDEGGITSHAAIVARELEIPCVIGTKTATKFLKNGEIVEVNANHGLVRKIE